MPWILRVGLTVWFAGLASSALAYFDVDDCPSREPLYQLMSTAVDLSFARDSGETSKISDLSKKALNLDKSILPMAFDSPTDCSARTFAEVAEYRAMASYAKVTPLFDRLLATPPLDLADKQTSFWLKVLAYSYGDSLEHLSREPYDKLRDLLEGTLTHLAMSDVKIPKNQLILATLAKIRAQSSSKDPLPLIDMVLTAGAADDTVRAAIATAYLADDLAYDASAILKDTTSLGTEVSNAKK